MSQIVPESLGVFFTICVLLAEFSWIFIAGHGKLTADIVFGLFIFLLLTYQIIRPPRKSCFCFGMVDASNSRSYDVVRVSMLAFIYLFGFIFDVASSFVMQKKLAIMSLAFVVLSTQYFIAFKKLSLAK